MVILVVVKNDPILYASLKTLHKRYTFVGTYGWRAGFLASFAHDSYYVRLAVEEGIIGLSLYMILLFTVLRRALYYYLRVYDPTIKTLYLAMLTSLFILAVANYPQEAIVQLPTSLVAIIFFAAIVRLKDFDIIPEESKNN